MASTSRSFRGRLTRAHMATLLLGLPSTALAQAASDTALQLQPVGITATRGAKPIDEVPATISVIDDKQLEQQSAVRPADVVRYEPGVTVGNQPARGGQSNYTIRGIGGNRVLVLQDGLRMQDFPSTQIGAGTYTRDFTDLDTVEQVEILRGPASALYGSDALGGVVNYILKDPGDYLDGTGKDTYFSGKAGYNGADNSYAETLTSAVRVGRLDLMMLYTRRDGHETDTNGSIRANPQVSQSNSFLGRAVLHATDVDTLKLTGEYTGRVVATDIASEEINTRPSGFTPGSNVLSSHGRDTTQRGALTLDWEHDAPILFIDNLRAKFSYSKLERREQTDLLRAAYSSGVAPGIANRRRLSNFQFDQELAIGDLQGTTRRTLLGVDHVFTYGATIEVTSTVRPRYRGEQNLVTGVVATSVGGETYPNKSFPDTTTTQAGFYAQDEIRIGRFEITPAVRFDQYNLSPHADALSNTSSGGLVVKSLSLNSVSPKLGIIAHFTDQYAIYAQYAHGFRAPPYDSTNFGFTNATSGYQIIPNGNLKSEKSDGAELGLRGKYADASWQISGFYNQYNNFIDTAIVGTSAAGLTQYQYVNLPEVKIWGAEARADWGFAADWKLHGAFAWARGEDSKTGKPIDSVDPVKLTTGIAWQHPTSGFGADAIVTAALQHDRVSSSTYYKAPGYATFDLLAHYAVNENLTLNGGIFNVTNAKYFVSQDVNGLSRTSATRDLYTQPGRSVSFNVTARW